MSILNEIIVPKTNADDIVLVRKIYFSNGDKVKKQDELIDLETSKTAIIVDTEKEGYIEYCTQVGDSVSIGEVIIKIHDSQVNAHKSVKENKAKLKLSVINFENKIVSNQALEYIKKNNINLLEIETNFVTLEDVNKSTPANYLKTDKSNDKHVSGTSELEINLAKLNEIKALSSVQSSGIVSTIFVTIDGVEEIKSYGTPMFNGSKSLLPLVVLESSRLLRKYPILNAYFDMNIIRVYDDINIGVAFDIDDGLKVYTIKNTDNLSLLEVESSISEGVDEYLKGEIKPEKLTGSTFTITDLSSFGVNAVIPLVNYNQSAILGVASIDEKLNRVNISLSFDHRVTEGKIASQFLIDLKNRIEAYINIYNVKNNINKNIKCATCMKSLFEDSEMQGIGFVKIINHDGNENTICRTCFEGWT